MVFEPLVFSLAQKRNYKKLFVELEGNIIITSSKPGQQSAARIRGQGIGSKFTNSLVAQMETFALKGDNAENVWENVLGKVKQETESVQIPVWYQIQGFYRPFIAKPMYDWPKAYIIVSKETNPENNNERSYYQVSPVFVSYEDFRYSVRELKEYVFKHTKVVTYYVYEKIGSGYAEKPRVFVSNDSQSNFCLSIPAAQEFLIKAVFTLIGGETHVININEKQ